jgi:phosphate transport system protein
MGAKVEEMLAAGLLALKSNDKALATRCASLEPQVDRLELELDRRCITILARWQPVASDLRFITSVLKMVTQLERIADHSEAICQRTLDLEQPAPPELRRLFIHMAEHVEDMVRDALDSFSTRHVDGAQDVIARDRTLDAYYAQCFPQLMRMMTADPVFITDAIRLQSIGKSLERIGDQATNIAELVVFMVRGKQLRHSPELRDAGAASGAFPVTSDHEPAK